MKLILPVAVWTLSAVSAHAAATVDNNNGTFLDDYSDGTGILTTPPGTVSAVRDTIAGAMTVAGTWTPPPACCVDTTCDEGTVCTPPPALTGHFSTVDIAPSSFNAWTSIAIEHRELVSGQLAVYFDAIAPDGTVVPFGPLPRIAASPSEAPFTLRFSLDGIDATLYPKGRARVAFTVATPIKASVSALRVSWRAIPKVKVVLEAPASVCSNGTLTLRDQVSVSYSDAKNFLLILPRPDGILPATPLPEVTPGPFAQNDAAIFGSATEGGLFHPGPGNLVLAPGAIVPPNHVYWFRPLQPAGTSFILSASFTVPQGLINQTRYSIQATATASNLTASGNTPIVIASNTATVTVGPTAPSPLVTRSLGNIYRIDGIDYSYPDRDITVGLTGYNYPGSYFTCGETYHQAYVWDDLTPIANKIRKPQGTLASGVFEISHSGQVSGPTGTTTWDGFQIPANVVYWDLRELDVGEWFSVNYKVHLATYVANGGTLVRDEVLTQCSTLRSDYRAAQSTGCRSLTIGVPDFPRGVFALGDRIRSNISVSASSQDNNTSALQFGERYSLAMYAGNSGASALNNVVMLNKLPAAVTFDSVYVPPSANPVVRYYIGTAFTDASVPPPLDVNGNPPAADAALWLSVPPADKKSVTWVYIQVPALGSTFFPDLVTAPSSVTGEIYVTVDQPNGACAEFLIHDLMVGRVYGYISPDMVVTSPVQGGLPRILPAGASYTPGSVSDSEWAEVRPQTPRANFGMSVWPTTLVGSGILNVNASIYNAQPGGSATGPMLDPKVVITIPSLAVNGGPATPLAFGGTMNAPGASVDYSLIGTTGQITFTYPTLQAYEGRSISFNLVVPKGFVSGSAMTASGVATGRDASCGPTSASHQATAFVRGEPSLYLTKTVDFGVAGPGSLLKYDLSIANLGQAVGAGAWVADRLPDAVTLTTIKKPANVTSVWFSSSPTLPELISPDYLFSAAIIQSNFVQGTYGAPDGNGDRPVTWPAGMTPRWVAWNVTDPTLNPPLLTTESVKRLSMTVTVNAGVPENTLAINDVLAFADGLLQTIGLRAVTIISPDPSLRLAVQCGPDVLAGEEPGKLVLPYYNDSANEDEVVTIEVDLAGHDYLGYTHTWNAVAQQLLRTHPITVAPLGGGRYLFTLITTSNRPLDSLEGGTLEVLYAPPGTATSGNILPITVLGLATNLEGDFSAFGRCQTLVSNPDIQVRKQIDQTDPPSGQRVTFTVFLKNAGAHWAPDVTLTDAIPADFTYVGGSAGILSPGWTGAPTVNGNTLTWAGLRKTGVTPPAGISPLGFIPGNTEVILTFKADVGQVGADYPLQNCASATTTLTEDDPRPLPVGTPDDNLGCVTARTPLPDPTLTKSGPASALPGERVTYTLTYRNVSRESANGTYIIDQLPFVPSDAYPTASAARYASHYGTHGETAYFSAAPRNGTQPAFNPTSPTNNGWRATPTNPVNWIAFVVPSPLPALSSTRTIQVDFDLVHPVSRRLPEAGTRFENCASVAMGGTGAVADSNPDNNAGCWTVGTPGIDLALSASCSPSGDTPGIRPGDNASYTLSVRNAGTTIAYGVRVTAMPGSRLDSPLVGSPLAQALDASGQPIALRNEAGDARTSPVEWTASGGNWLLGSAQPGSATHYRTVGIPPGGVVTLTFTGTVSPETLSEEVVVNAGQVAPDYGLGFVAGVSEEEDNTTNNAASCQVTTYRPDLVLIKDVELMRNYPAGALASGVGNVGDTLRYKLTVSNLGRAAATNPRLQDFFPAGTRFIPGTLDGDLGGAVVEYADANFNWGPIATPDSIGLRLVFPGNLDVGGSGVWNLDSGAELGADGFSVDGAYIDQGLGAVLPIPGEQNELGCSSGQSYTLPANRTSPTHYAMYMSGGFYAPFDAHTYTYPEASSGCCLDSASMNGAYQLCQEATQNEQMNWNMMIQSCDNNYAMNDLTNWAQCLCNAEGNQLQMQCEADCQMQWSSCIMMAQSLCLMDYNDASTTWMNSGPTDNCGPDLYWIDRSMGYVQNDSYRMTLQTRCENEVMNDASGCGGAAMGNCAMFPATWTDSCGIPRTTDHSDLMMLCQMDYQSASTTWSLQSPANFCSDINAPYWVDNRTGMTNNWYANTCQPDCSMGGMGPCGSTAMNYVSNCMMNPGSNASMLSPEWAEVCGSQPTYPCFEQVGPPPEDRCNTATYCNGSTPPTASSTYVTPIGPTADGSVRVQNWVSLLVDHTFEDGDLRLDLLDDENAPIAGFQDLGLDALGNVSLASLPNGIQGLRIKATFNSQGESCFTTGPLRDIMGTQLEMNGWGMTRLPTSFPPLVLPDGRMVRALYETNGMSDYPVRLDVTRSDLFIDAAGGISNFRLPPNTYNSAEPWFGGAADGTIVGPHTVMRGMMFSNYVGTAIQALQDSYTFEVLPFEDFDPTWGYRIYDNWAGMPWESMNARRLVASKDLVVAPVLSADEAGWHACNEDLEAACQEEVDAAIAYYDKVAQCALWVDCLEAALSACNSDEDSTCDTLTEFTGQCAHLDHEAGCDTDEYSNEFSDYQNFSMGMTQYPYALNCEARLAYGDASYGMNGQYGYAWHGFQGFDEEGMGGYDFGMCDMSVQGSVTLRLAVFERDTGGASGAMERGAREARRDMGRAPGGASSNWKVTILDTDPAEGIYSQASSSVLLDITSDGSAILAQENTRLVVWRRTQAGTYTPEVVASDVPWFGQSTAALGGLSEAGDFAWVSMTWQPGGNRVATRTNGTWTAASLGPTTVVQGGHSEGRVFFGVMNNQQVRWVPSAQGYVTQTPSPADLTPALISGSSLTWKAIGRDGTVAGSYSFFDSRYPNYPSWPAQAGFIWPPDGEGPIKGFTLEAGIGLAAAHVTDDRRVLGYYEQLQVGMVTPSPAYGAFEYACGSTSRPSLDRLLVNYEAADSAEITFDVGVADLCQPEITNIASVENDVPEITLSNNTDDAKSGVNAVTLEVDVKASKVAVSLNDPIVYTYTLKNAGPGRPQGVAVTGALSPYVTIQPGSDKVDQTFAELAPGETKTWQVSTLVNTNLPNLPLTATVAVDTDTIQCDLQRTSASATSLTGSWPNVAVTKTGPPTATVSSGTSTSTISYTLVVASNGNDLARNVVLTDTLPSGATYVSSNPAGSHSNGTVTWALNDLAAGASVPVTVTVEVPSCAAVGTTLTNTAAVATTSLEADTSDNTSIIETSLQAPLGRLRTSTSIDRTRVATGGRLWYTVRYWNQGNAPVTDATLTVPLPANATFVTGSATGGVTPAANTLTWNLGTVGLGASGSVGFAVTANGGLVSGNPVAVDGIGTCPFTAALPTANTQSGGLVISKTADVASVCATEQATITWSITVINRNAGTLSNVNVTDAVPSGTSYVGGSITGVGANAVGAPTLTWTIPTLQPGRGVTLTYRTTTPTGVLTFITNNATASANGIASVTSNTAEVLADCSAPVALAKSWTGVCSLQGQAFAVTLTARNRTGTARTIDLTDTLPSTLVVIDRGGSAGTGNDLTWAAVTLPALGTATRTFTVRVADGVADGTPISNQASLAGVGLLATSNPVTSVPITCAAPSESECQTVACTVDGQCIYPAINNGVTCSDDTACTTGDVCSNGACVGATLNCDDSNACTVDSCNPLEGCERDLTTLAGTACIDGNACTTGDVCNTNGGCTPGSPRDCNDDNPCTDDSCDPERGCVHVANTATCDDGNECTNGDTCADTECVSGPALQCNDDEACTDDSCNPDSGCVYAADNTNTCNDGLFCTTADRCEAGDCVGTARACADTNDCTADSCDETLRTCVFDGGLLNGNICDDGSECTTNDVCINGGCGGSQVTCGEGDCAGTCDPEMGCDYSTSNQGACDDGNECTTDEICDEGVCVAGEPRNCDDGDACTGVETCDPSSGCVNGEPLECDDMDACTGVETCEPATGCVNGEPLECDDMDACTGVETCEPATGCVNGEPLQCDDMDACNGEETCEPATGCVNGEPLQCDDMDACTGEETCDPSSGCVDGEPLECDDMDACTGEETCDPSSGCVNGEPLECDDMDACTGEESCDPAMGCVGGESLECDDMDVCNGEETCDPSVGCVDGELLVCNDNEGCTLDSCDPGEGCVYDGAAMDTEPCDADEDACTPVDTCIAGECVPDAPTSCDGEGGCLGTCDSQTGLCGYMPDLCNDDDACTTGEVCTIDGECGGGVAVTCPAGDNECQLAYCDSELGCELDLLSGATCDDGDDCTEDDLCESGECAAGPDVVCDDNDECTADACVNGSCVFTPTATGDVDDTCDGIDDDCDGQTDEDYQVAITCGLGECEGTTGLEICRNGQPLRQCDDKAGATAEMCDGLDNDCDGFIDNGFMDTDCAAETVIYLIVNDPNGEPYGTARCYQPTGNGPIRCDTDPTDPTGRKLRVFDALLCPVE